jgi:hypothetical protein
MPAHAPAAHATHATQAAQAPPPAQPLEVATRAEAPVLLAASPTTISNQIFAKCSAALGLSSSRCDGITAANFELTTANNLASIYKSTGAGNVDQWRIMGLLLEADFLGKACTTRINGMYDWLQAISRRVGPKRMSLSQINSGLYELYPFVKMGRKGIVNNEYWNATGGVTWSGNTPGTTDPPTAAGATWKLTVTSQTGITPDMRWFPPKLRVEIMSVSPGGSHSQTEYEVVAREQVPSTGTPTSLLLYLKDLNTGSFFAAGKPSSQPAKIAAPVTGLLVRGTPNVSDYESYCPEIPGLNTNQIIPFWIETTRWSYRVCELMERYLDAIRKNNPYYREFGDVPSVELNKQIQTDFERREANSFFFNKPLLNQDLNNYGSLPDIQIADGTVIKNPYGGRVVGKRAAATGIYEQHAECGRVFDLQGQTLNLVEWFNGIYQMLRVREAIGTQTDFIEVWTDENYAMLLQQGLYNYFTSKTGGLFRVNYDLCGKCYNAPFGFKWRQFQLDFPNVELRIVTHPYFNDMQAAAQLAGGTSLQTVGRQLWMIDWNVNYQMIFDTNSVMLTQGDLNRLAEVDFSSYGCVMKLPRDRQKLMSKTYTNVTECPAASMFLENIAPTVPEWRGAVGNPGDYYGYAG